MLAGAVFFVCVLLFAREPLSLLFAVIFHEAAHITCASVLGLSHPDIRAAAGVRVMYHGIVSPAKGVLLCLSGPVASIVLAVIIHLIGISETLSLYSLGLGLMNLLPITVLDGGCALRHICEATFTPDASFRICRCVSVIFTIVILVFNTLIQLKFGVNISLLSVSVYFCVCVLSQ